MKLEEVRWGIVGCGDVTEVKNGPPLYKTGHSKLVAVMRRNGELAADFAKRHGVPKWFDQAEDLINDSDVNAVYVATPPGTHAQYAIQAMRAGKPVYVEKPMARNHAECQEMIRVSKETGMPLFVAFYRRALPLFLKVKEIIDQGILGKPLVVNIRFYQQAPNEQFSGDQLPWRLQPDVAGGGLFYDLASHKLDFLDFVFGPVAKVNGQAANYGGLYPAEDTVSASFEFENGVLGTGSWCFVTDSASEEDTIEMIGTKGKLWFSCFNPVRLTLKTEQGEISYDYESPQHVGGGLIQLLVDDLRGVGKCPSTGISAARTNWVMEEITKNYYSS
ncbi:MAG TPA: Gfo/Idh/MocA family oxidoreductase [Sunxiuqinia sp.]|nr:Gfo/Idh/MocA family oxidoreductase [Sunxiuqinia sp.]